MSENIGIEAKESSVVNISRTGYSFNTIALQSANSAELIAFLEQKIAPHKDAYENTPVIIDVSNVNHLQDLDYPLLQEICKKYSLFLLGLSGALTEERAKALIERDIPVVNSNRFARMREENFKPKVITKTFEVKVPVKVPVPYEVKVPVEVKKPEPLMVITRNIRSGETVQAPGNSVVIFGSVANGARVIASHNILVFGDLYGEVYAGSPKDAHDPGFKEAFVFTDGLFNPTFVAIAGNYQTADDMEKDPVTGPIHGQNHALIVALNGKALRFCLAKDFLKN